MLVRGAAGSIIILLAASAALAADAPPGDISAPSQQTQGATQIPPAPAVSMAAILMIVAFLAWAPFVGPGDYYAYTSTIGVLALILVYIAVSGAEMVEAWEEKRRQSENAALKGRRY